MSFSLHFKRFRMVFKYIGMLAPGSLKYVGGPLVLGGIVFFFQEMVGVILIVVGIYMAWFFRDPDRDITEYAQYTYAPADGRVIFLEEDDATLKIGIRMSPFDVHINRTPLSGTVTKIQHQPGKHSSVYFGDVSNKNERNLIVLENEELTAEILQITGMFARRIECWVEKGNIIQQGSRIGMIRFGSQTNLLLKNKQDNKTRLKPQITVGSRVRAGLTVVASLEVKEDE